MTAVAEPHRRHPSVHVVIGTAQAAHHDFFPRRPEIATDKE
jgi:hypothetical protein